MKEKKLNEKAEKNETLWKWAIAFKFYLHDSDDGAAVLREILNNCNNISRIEKRLGMSGEEHEEAHNSHGRVRDDPDDGQPYEEVANEALDGSGEVDQPWASSGRDGIGDGGVE